MSKDTTGMTLISRVIDTENRLAAIEKELKILQPVEEFKRGEVVYYRDSVNGSVRVGFFKEMSNDENYPYSIHNASKVSWDDWKLCSKTNPLLNTDESN